MKKQTFAAFTFPLAFIWYAVPVSKLTNMKLAAMDVEGWGKSCKCSFNTFFFLCYIKPELCKAKWILQNLKWDIIQFFFARISGVCSEKKSSTCKYPDLSSISCRAFHQKLTPCFTSQKYLGKFCRCCELPKFAWSKAIY